MACQVEMINGNGAFDRESSPENESDIEIMALKEKLLNENLNGIVNGKLEEASSSNNSINNNGPLENGHTDEKTATDSEFEVDVVAEKQPSKRNRGKIGKGKAIATPKSKRLVKKSITSVAEEESIESEKIEVKESFVEDDTSIIDVGDTEDMSAIIEEGESSVQQDTSVEMNSCDEKMKDVDEQSSYFSRLRDRMRFSISPQKHDAAASSSYSLQKSGNEGASFRSVSGRRALHQSPPTYNFNDSEPVTHKRRLESEDLYEPEAKRFMPCNTSGWKFFPSPFSRFWSETKTKKSVGNTTVSSSTPLRKLHEDMEDSMAVNVDESFNISLDEEQEIDNAKPGIEEKQSSDSKSASWKCSIM